MSIRSRSHPLMIQGLRTNPKDQDSHVLFFDVEALIGNCFVFCLLYRIITNMTFVYSSTIK